MTTLSIGKTVCKGPLTLLVPPAPETLPDMTYLTCGARVKELMLVVAVEVNAKETVAFSAFSNKNRLSNLLST